MENKMNEKAGSDYNEEIVLAQYSYKALHKLIKSGMWKMYCNKEFEITSVEWSDDLRHMIGYTDENDFPNVFDVWADLLHPEDRDCVLNGIDPVLRDTTGNTIFDQDYRLYTKHEGYRWFHVSADVLRREDGTPKCFFGIFIDVTEQKEHDQLEKARDEALKKANDALTAMNVLHEAIGSGAWSNTYDEEGRLVKVEWSDAFRALLGFSSREDFPDTNEAFFTRVHKDDKERLMAEYKKALYDTTGKIVYDTEFRAKTKEGTYRWFRTTGRITGTARRTFHGMIIDIDEKKRTDAELVWRDTLADIITRNLDSVYIVMNKKNRHCVYVSPSIESIFGIDKEISKPLLEVQKLEQDITNDFTIEEIINLAEGDSLVQDCWIKPIGSTKAKMFQKALHHVIRDKEDLLIFAFTDYTYEQEVRKNIQDALEIAKNANAAKSNFLSNMSHDIRTPMNAIVGLATLMEHEQDDPQKMQEYIQKIQASSNHMLGLINDVLDMSKIESGGVTLNNEEFNLKEQIKELDMLIRPQTMLHDQDFEIREENIIHDNLEGDALRLRQVLVNILSNAVKYTQDHGRIRFTISEVPSKSELCAKYKFSVQDNGMGIKQDYLKRIFEPFTRQENSVTNTVQGTGLGMAITKNIVDMMGGIIRVYSKEGQGSTFEVILELKIGKEKTKRKISQSQDQNVKEQEIILDGMHFLCAEDNDLNAEILQELLEMSGAECTICSDGKELIEKFQKAEDGRYDMILMDIQMPVMNGYETAKKIRDLENKAKRIPIIAMTANAFTEDVQNSLDAGMDAHISKPMDLEMLKNTVYRLKHN